MSANLDNLPLDLLQEAAAALDHYVRIRRREKLLEERAYLQRELRAARENRAEIEALAPTGSRPQSTEENNRA